MIRFTAHAMKRMAERGVNVEKAKQLFLSSQLVKNYDENNTDQKKEFWYNKKNSIVFVVRRVDPATVVCITVIRREAGNMGLAMYKKDVKPIDQFVDSVHQSFGI